MAPAREKPLIVVTACPAAGHTLPMLKVASVLVQRGYEVTAIASNEFRDSIDKSGASCVPISSGVSAEAAEIMVATPPGPGKLINGFREFFSKPADKWRDALYKALEDLKSKAPDREIVIVSEGIFMGAHALYYGAPLPVGFKRRPRIINIHALLYMMHSIDTAPTGLAIIPEATEEARQKYAELTEQQTQVFGTLKDIYGDLIIKRLGPAPEWEPAKAPMDNFFTSGDVMLHLYPPSIEYLRSDWHPRVRVIGALPRAPLDLRDVSPSLADEVAQAGRKVVAVTQGTFERDYEQLIIPTLTALAERGDLLVVAILGARGATLRDDFKVPENARVVDFLAYDAILPHTSVFVLNAGFGGFIHGVVNGVPMVLAGQTQDKPEVAAHGEWAGIGINLRSQSPSAERIGGAVDTILGDPKYKARVVEIQKENESMNAADVIEQHVLEQAALSAAEQ